MIGLNILYNKKASINSNFVTYAFRFYMILIKMKTKVRAS